MNLMPMNLIMCSARVGGVGPVWRALTIALACTSLSAIAMLPAQAQSETAQSENGPSVALIFDGSGSMWGAVPGGSGAKFEVAREALAKALEDGDVAAARVGLVGFGLRTRGSCDRVETPLAPTAGGARQMLGALARLNPRGRGPVGAALDAAAETLAEQPGPHRILMIHDGDDNCGANTCEIAKALKAKQPDLTINVLTLAPTSDTPLVACLGALTGGRVIQTLDRAEIESGLADLVRGSFAPAQASAAPSVPTPAQAGRPGPAIPAGISTTAGRTGLDLAANLAEPGPQATLALRWSVIPSTETTAGTAGASPAAIFRTGPTAAVDLAPGTYDVIVETGPATVQNRVTIEADQRTRLIVDLASAELSFTARLGADGDNIPDVDIEVRRRDADSRTPPLYLATTRSGALVLPQGSYIATGRKGLLSETIELDVVAGAVQSVGFQLPGARVTATYAQGDDQPPASISMLADRPDQALGSAPLATTLGPTATFYVPAGAYVLSARSGDVEVMRPINVAQGQKLDLRLATRIGSLRLETRIDGQAEPFPGSVQYELLPLGPGAPTATTLFGRDRTLQLPIGRYRISSIVEASGARASRDIEVAAGVAQTVSIVHRLGRLELVLAGADAAASRAAASVDWRIETAGGQLVWLGLGREVATLLPPGRYTVLANGHRESAKTVDVRTGETSVVTIAAP